jgi:uncharacterized repeat protein (TIGR03803 family)
MKHRLARLSIVVTALALAVCVHAATKGTILYKFLRKGDGAYYPLSNLVFDKAGNMYGTASQGGTNNEGVVFELSPQSGGGWIYNVIYTFTGAEGAMPQGPLTMDSAGNLYGLATAGPTGWGTIFELSPNGSGGWTATTPYVGTSAANSPTGPVILDGADNLYGTAGFGAGNNGFVYKLTSSSAGWTFQDIFDFNGTDGGEPANVVMDTGGNLYGTTVAGGLSTKCKGGCGVVFELAQSSGVWNEQVLLNFNQANGSIAGPLTLDNSGNLFGVTATGGPKGFGIVYELSQSGGLWTQTLVHAFSDTNTDGSYPRMPLLLNNGDIYGTTMFGGSGGCSGSGGQGCGTLFRLSPSGTTWQENVLEIFNGASNGATPWGIATDGTNLFGVTQSGGGTGINNAGEVYEVSPE